MIPATGEKKFKQCFHGRMTRGGKGRWQLQQDFVLNRRRRLASDEGGGGDKPALWNWCGPCGSGIQVVKTMFEGCKKGDVSQSLSRAMSGRFWRQYTREGKVLQEQSLFTATGQQEPI